MLPPMKSMLWHTVWRLFGGDINDRERCIAVYQQHNAGVIASVPAERLLVYCPGDGWEPLCAFIGCPAPDEPYPRLNDSATFIQGVARLDPETASQEG